MTTKPRGKNQKKNRNTAECRVTPFYMTTIHPFFQSTGEHFLRSISSMPWHPIFEDIYHGDLEEAVKQRVLRTLRYWKKEATMIRR